MNNSKIKKKWFMDWMQILISIVIVIDKKLIKNLKYFLIFIMPKFKFIFTLLITIIIIKAQYVD